MIRDSYTDTPYRDRQSLSASPIFVCTALAGLILFTLWFLGAKAYHFTDLQMAEFLVYFILMIGVPGTTVWVLMKQREWKENQRRYPPLVISPAVDARHVKKAWDQSAVVLGYDVHGTPWLWPDKVRVMQGIVVGMTGSGKTTLLKNIITQDLTRRIGPAQDRHKIPMVIFDGKGDLDFFYELLPHINRAGRLGDLRLINPARPDLSCLYNPFHTTGWMDFTSFQMWRRPVHEWMLAQRRKQEALGRIIPQTNEKYGYEDHYPRGSSYAYPDGQSADGNRRAAWEISMAGAYQTTGETAKRGTGVWPDTGGGWVNGRGDDTMIMLNGYAQMVDFFKSFEWWKGEPRDDLADNGAFCLAEPGRLYALYLPRGGRVRVKLETGRYQASWFNARTGQTSSAGAAEGPSWTSPQAPDSGDWALLLKRIEGTSQ